MSMRQSFNPEYAKECLLCKGTGENRIGIKLSVNNHICIRCGGYGSIPKSCPNPNILTEKEKSQINRKDN